MTILSAEQIRKLTNDYINNGEYHEFVLECVQYFTNEFKRLAENHGKDECWIGGGFGEPPLHLRSDKGGALKEKQYKFRVHDSELRRDIINELVDNYGYKVKYDGTRCYICW